MRAGQRAPRWLPKVSRVSGPSLALRDGDGNLRSFCARRRIVHVRYVYMVTCVCESAPGHAPRYSSGSHVIYSPEPRRLLIRAAATLRVCARAPSIMNSQIIRRSCHFHLSVCAFRFRVRLFFLCLCIPGAADPNFWCGSLCFQVMGNTRRSPLGVCLYVIILNWVRLHANASSFVILRERR
jgi:hypothetical protein